MGEACCNVAEGDCNSRRDLSSDRHSGELVAFRELIDSHLSHSLAARPLEDRLRETIHYVLFPGGRRIRPSLALAVCADLGADAEAVVSAACAIEVLHCASLVHDDLPAIDNDDIRRGRPACHKQFGEATAILAADYMVPWAIQMVTESERLSPSQRLSLSMLMSTAYCDLCRGQQLDLLDHERRSDLTKIHRLKTGALFSAAMAVGAVAAEIQDLAPFALVGEEIGIAFQLCNDLADVEADFHGGRGSSGRLGSSDKKNGRLSFLKTSPGGESSLSVPPLGGIRANIRGLLQRVEAKCGAFPRTGVLVEGLLAALPETRLA